MRRLIAALCLLPILLLCAVGALGTADVHAVDLSLRHASPSSRHWLGTDHLGRDVFARLAEGGWRAISVMLIAAVMTLGGALVLGLAATLAVAPLRLLAQRVAEMLALLPDLVIAILVVAVIGPSPLAVALGLGLAGIGPAALLVQGLARQTLRETFVAASYALGATSSGVARRHVLPAVLPALLTHLASHIGHIVLSYSAIAFLGLGADSGAPDWGAMLFEYRAHLFDAPSLLVWPCAALMLLNSGIHLLIEPRDTSR
ncbi:MAG: hypothetical protein RLZ83_2140 [Pseudomonadota bacterium]|jgi:ABC-type dipeptide/oligopeptide/nickel transport system permease subunit